MERKWRLGFVAALLALIAGAGTAMAQETPAGSEDGATEDERAQLQHRNRHRAHNGAQAESREQQGDRAAAEDGQQLRHRHRVRTRAARGNARVEPPAPATNSAQNRARFVDRNGDGICDHVQARKAFAKRLHKGKIRRNGHLDGSQERGFGRGGRPAAAGAQ